MILTRKIPYPSTMHKQFYIYNPKNLINYDTLQFRIPFSMGFYCTPLKACNVSSGKRRKRENTGIIHYKYSLGKARQ